MPTLGFTLVPVVRTPPPAVVGEEQPYAPSESAATIVLGRGVVGPFQRDGRGDWATAEGEALVRANVEQILGTMCSSGRSHGELPWRPEFGSLVYMLRHGQNDDVLKELAQQYVVDALELWEPRVKIRKSRITNDPEAGKLEIFVVYDIVSRRRRTAIATGIEQSFKQVK